MDIPKKNKYESLARFVDDLELGETLKILVVNDDYDRIKTWLYSKYSGKIKSAYAKDCNTLFVVKK